jgi:hypothetical protein
MRPDVCPICGEMVPEDAKACPECGACEETGWSDDARADALGIPPEEFDYEGYVKREFEGENPKRKMGGVWNTTSWVLIVIFGTGVATLIIWAALALLRRS